MKTCLFCICLWIVSTSIFARTKVDSGELSLIDNFHYLIDSSEQLGVDQVQQLLDKGNFSRVNGKVIHLSIAQPVVWIAIDQSTDQDNLQYLSPGNESNVWLAELYAKDSSGRYNKIFEYDHLKDDQDASSLSFSTLAINLPLGKEDFLLRLYGRNNRNYSMILGDLNSMSKYLVLRERVPVVFIGFMLCVFIYNSFLFLSTRLRIFIPYLIYLLTVTYAILFHSGFVIFSTVGMWPGESWYTVWLSPLYVAAGLFSIQYLNLKKIAPELRKLILVLMLFLIFVVPIVDINQLINLNVLSILVPVIVILYCVCLWISGIYVWINGVKHARFYVIGWVFVILSLMVFYLTLFDVFPYHHNIDFALYFGFAAEAVLFAFALGDQMNIMRKEKQSMERVHLESTREKNRLLAQQLYMNSHLLRAPLSRILGLIGLLKNPTPENKELLDHVTDATLEMDDVTRKMSALLEQEGYLDQYQDDFAEVRQSIYKDNENGSE